ncbi:MAG: Cro/Cl family transcriptional regulator [Candidatus Omnitrophica bacterium CG12_big_fil_rev_8_21_14_0_65_42_8]|nr:MAG: Cro/Cl family transcriptional regulator [Candidatus Omnitrophica bacterium CG12_big_fil_rev_8_21_14_0_65_42_8]
MPIKVHLSKLLGERKLRASEVARKTGINKNTLSSLYNESISGIRFDTLEKICKFLNCSIGDLIEYIPKKTGTNIH